MNAIMQYLSTTYWGTIIACNVLIILFIAFWIHTSTMTKRYKRLEERFNRLEFGLVNLRNMLQSPLQQSTQYQQPPAQQGAMPTQQFQSFYQPPVY